MRRAAAMFAMLVGCGARTPLEVSGTTLDAASEGSEQPTVYCSSPCGEVDAASGPQVVVCDPGQICGETGGIEGFICCEPSPRCHPGLPLPGNNCP